jgi:hypothetical protein
MALEDYLNGICSFDIEVKHWWTDKPIVYLISIVSDRGDFVGGEFGIGRNYVESAVGRKAEYLCFNNNQEALIRWAGGKQRELDLPVEMTQNGLAYDYVELALRQGCFKIGPDNSEPKILKLGYSDRKSKDGETLTKRRHPAAIDFDLMLWASSNLKFALPDARLETIASLAHNFFGARIGYTKSHTYEQQKIDVEIAQHNPEVAYGLARYAYEDALATFEAGKSLMRIPVNIAKATGCPLFSAFNDRKRKIAVYVGSRKHYELHGAERGERKYLEGDRVSKLKARLMKEGLEPEFAKGIFSKVLVGYLPMHDSIHLPAVECKSNLLAAAHNAQNPLEKIIYHQLLDEFLAEPLVKIIDDEKYGARKYKAGSFAELEGRMRGWLAEARKALAGNRLINISKGLLFIEQKESVDALVKKGFVPWDYADIVSVESEAVVYKMRNEILSTGIKIPSAKRWQECDAPKDHHPNIKIKAMRSFVENVFVDKALALKELGELAKSLASNSIPATDYLQRVNCKELPEDRSDTEQQKLKTRVEKELGLKPGEDAIFGVMDKGDGSKGFVRYDPETKTFDRNFIPFTKHYLDTIFGKQSRMWDIASAVYLNKADANYASKKTALESTMYGRGTENDIAFLVS